MWRLIGTLIRNYARYLEEINIRVDKLLLYHCLLELGSPKVNVSEQFPQIRTVDYSISYGWQNLLPLSDGIKLDADQRCIRCYIDL
jgi:hypothetical protein